MQVESNQLLLKTDCDIFVDRQCGAIPLAAAKLARPVAGSAAQTKHTGEMMFQKFITVFIVTAAIAFAASGLPLSSIFGAGFGSGFFNLPLIF